MSVFSRLSDIVNANLSAMLDEAEDPAKMVRMITHEMEETLVEVRSTSARYIADRKHITTRIERLAAESRLWDEKAEMALRRGRDDLARAALKEKSRQEEAATLLEADLAHIDEAITRLKHDTGQLEEKLRTARARQKALILRGRTAQSRIRVKRQLSAPAYDDAMDRFERYERRLDEMEGEVESLDLGNASLADEIDQLAKDERIDAQLNALKARIARSAASTQPGESS